jgi:glutathione S-transferase
MSVVLFGYEYSVYSWVARFALEEKGVHYRWSEVNPFAENVPGHYLTLHPFKRVPVLAHGAFDVYETTAITRYADEAFTGPSLQPFDPQRRARMNQCISIADSYGYWPLVRQVFSHRVFRPTIGKPFDENEVATGLRAARAVLGALDRIAGPDRYLCGPDSKRGCEAHQIVCA